MSTVLASKQSDTPLGWQPEPDLTLEQFSETFDANLSAVDAVERLMPWVVGDMLRIGSELFSEEQIDELIDPAKYCPSTLNNWRWVSGQFDDIEIRRQIVESKVKHSVVAAFAGIKDKSERYELLRKAIANKWTVKDARLAVKTPGDPSKPVITVSLPIDPLKEKLDALQQEINQEKKISRVGQAAQELLNFFVEKEIWGNG